MGRDKGGIHGTINMTTSLLCILDFLWSSFPFLEGLDWFVFGFVSYAGWDDGQVFWILFGMQMGIAMHDAAGDAAGMQDFCKVSFHSLALPQEAR
jgi:hypothetical protein